MTRLKLLFVLVTLMVAPMAFAGTYTLNDWCFYVNSLDINQSCNSGGGLANVPLAAPGVTDLLHLQTDNTGNLTVTLAPGNYSVFAIFNYNIDGSGLNESARTVGQPSAGQVYSVNSETGSANSLDAQGSGGSFDNTNYLATCTGSACPDMAVGLGYTDLNVPIGSTGTVTFTAGTTPPASGFYVEQKDNASGNTIDLSSSVQIDGNLSAQISAVPEPGSMGLMATGFGALLCLLRRRKG